MDNKYFFVPFENKAVKFGQLRIKYMPGSDLVQSVLRARTVLAFLHSCDQLGLHPYPADPSKALWVNKALLGGPDDLLAKQEIATWLPAFEELASATIAPFGGMLVLTDTTAGWSSQCPALLLPRTYTPEALAPAFNQSLRWLDDRPEITALLRRIWGRGQHAKAS